ncbi:hypothetical protein [Calorimonas adulescens]|uniref:Uncharacterized protein n=1 Tax=Calorimonas adulescens TaxID=2606906 RepID=A0A5D8QE05_9THEO|nr:hypothetical protein [Calorimonas adulescens]TZE82930.1 hypothetical protein FWJ32_02960 [Calorimonas adulescens]
MRRLCIYILTFLIVFGNFITAYAKQPGNVVMIILNGLTLDDLKDNDLPNIKRLIDTGCIAVMNSNAAATKNEPGSFLTIGAGVRAYAGVETGQGYNEDEEYINGSAGDFYSLYTGMMPYGEVVVPGILQIKKANEGYYEDIRPGLMGETLKDAGIPVTVLGNSDRPNIKRRYAPLIGMDEDGVVAYGDVSSRMNIEDSSYPFLTKTNYDYLNEKLKDSLDRGGLTIVELGDMARVDDFMSFTSQERGMALRSKVLRDIDEFIGNILNEVDISRDMVMIVDPYPGRDSLLKQEMLTPIIVAGPGFGNGYLKSDTTKRPGIVANLDVAVTVLNYFGIDKPAVMAGHRLYNGGSGSLESLYEMNQRTTAVHVIRPVAVRYYVGVQIGILFVSLLFIYLLKRYVYIIKYLLMGDMLVPFILLILPMFDIRTLSMTLLAITGLSAVMIYIISLFLKDSYKIVTFIGLVTVFAIALDLFTGANLIKTSVLGYDPIGGARYYGIGNEYVGVLIGAALLGISGLMDRYNIRILRYISIGIMMILIFLVAAPSYGTNLGGTIAAAMAFFTFAILIIRNKVTFRDIIYAGILTTAVVLCLFIVDMFIGATHIGELARNVATQGMGALNEVAIRKLATNLRLIRYTIWTRVLLASIIVLAALSYRPTDMLKKLFAEYPYLYKGFVSGLIGTLFVLVANDSGIVAAATLIIFIVPPIVIMTIDRLIGERYTYENTSSGKEK